MRPWSLTDGPVKEGKYLVVRRDGTIPTWPHFVLGGDDPCAPAALQAYARAAEELGWEADYVAGVRELAAQYERRPVQKAADPYKGPHRLDNPIVVEAMREPGWRIGSLGQLMRDYNTD